MRLDMVCCAEAHPQRKRPGRAQRSVARLGCSGGALSQGRGGEIVPKLIAG